MNGTATISAFKYASAGEVYSLGSVLPVVAAAIVALRFYTRRIQHASYGVDDWLILASLILFVGAGICLIIGGATGSMGYPTPTFPVDLYTDDEVAAYLGPTEKMVQQLEFGIQLLTVTCKALVKCSAICFFRRILVARPNSPFDITAKVSLVVIVLWAIACLLLVIFACPTHVTASWGSFAESEMYCAAIGYTSLIGIAASDLITDVYVLSLPIPFIWKLSMGTVKKLAVTGVMLLGATSIAASIVRLVIYVQVQTLTSQFISTDWNQACTLLMWWTTLESGLALIAACLPSLNYLFVRASKSRTFDSLTSLFGPRTRRFIESEDKYVGPDNSSGEMAVSVTPGKDDGAMKIVCTARNNYEKAGGSTIGATRQVVRDSEKS